MNENAKIMNYSKFSIQKPIKITPYNLDEKINYYYRYFKNRKSPAKYLLVIVKYLNGHGFIITAYFVRSIK